MMMVGLGVMMMLMYYVIGILLIIFGSGYVFMGKWWGVGFVMVVVELLVFVMVGMVWWKLLGYW